MKNLLKRFEDLMVTIAFAEEGIAPNSATSLEQTEQVHDHVSTTA